MVAPLPLDLSEVFPVVNTKIETEFERYLRNNVIHFDRIREAIRARTTTQGISEQFNEVIGEAVANPLFREDPGGFEIDQELFNEDLARAWVPGAEPPFNPHYKRRVDGEFMNRLAEETSEPYKEIEKAEDGEIMKLISEYAENNRIQPDRNGRIYGEPFIKKILREATDAQRRRLMYGEFSQKLISKENIREVLRKWRNDPNYIVQTESNSPHISPPSFDFLSKEKILEGLGLPKDFLEVSTPKGKDSWFKNMIMEENREVVKHNVMSDWMDMVGYEPGKMSIGMDTGNGVDNSAINCTFTNNTTT